MPAKTIVHKLFPSHDIHIVKKHKLALDGRFEDHKAKISVPLMPGFATKNARNQSEIWIDMEQGIQVKYGGLKGWVGVPGRFTYASQVRKDARDLQTRGINFEKFLWPVVIFILGTFAALVAMPMIIAQAGA